MPGHPADSVSDRSMQAWGPAPFQCADLKPGAVYALAVETAAARLPLLLAPLLAALRAGRRCVLITSLNPDETPFAEVLCRTRQVIELADGGSAGQLKVFTAVGDYAVNLFLHGADRYLQELDQFEISPGSLLLIDGADDLYTPHDHAALVHQARAYRTWCERHLHTMVQLHLRTGPHRPLMDGNQIASQHFSGLARVTSQPEGLTMLVDFWASPTAWRTGSVIRLDLPPPAVARVAPALPSVWYVGQQDVDLDLWSHQFTVHRAASLSAMLPWQPDRDDLGLVITLDSLDQFAAFVEQIAQLRAAVGDRMRIIVRETRYRLREHTQKRRLLRAGADLVLPVSVPLEEMASLLQQPQLVSVVEKDDAPRELAEPLAMDLQEGDEARWLGGPAFVDEAARRMQRSLSLKVPCVLAEIDFEGVISCDSGIPSAPSTPLCQAGRKGDLSTSTLSTQFFFLQACRGRDVVNVVTRSMDSLPMAEIQRIQLYTAESAIARRLEALRLEIASEVQEPETEERSLSNVVTMPAAGRVSQLRGLVSVPVLTAMAIALALSTSDALAQRETTPAVPEAVSATVESSGSAYERGNYGEAARIGLMELQRAPSDHELRLRVANSLAWTGQYKSAIEQYGLLAATPLAKAASMGLANVHLWSGNPHLADPLLRSVLANEPANADALQGLAVAGRHLRPRTTLRGSWIDDSSQVERSAVTLGHRWRDAGLKQIFEVSGERVEEKRSPDALELHPRKVSFGYQHMGLPLAPKIQLTRDSGVKSAWFGNLGLQLAAGAATLDVGRVNWGEQAFEPRARQDGLAATRIGVAGRVDASIGGFSGGATHFRVSDGNRIQEISAQYTPAWQPFPAATGLKAFVGFYDRRAKRRDPRYWSPEKYAVGQVGLSLNRSSADWDLNVEVKRSLPAGGEGAQGWTAGLGGTRWLNRDWALRLEGFHIETRRDNSAYRSKSMSLSLDRLW